MMRESTSDESQVANRGLIRRIGMWGLPVLLFLMAAAPPAYASTGTGEVSEVVVSFTVFVLAVFIGYHVVWNVTPALHTPLMSVTNAISGIIVVGAMLAAGPALFDFGTVGGFLAVTLASVCVFGGFVVTQRMLEMFKKK